MILFYHYFVLGDKKLWWKINMEQMRFLLEIEVLFNFARSLCDFTIFKRLTRLKMEIVDFLISTTQMNFLKIVRSQRMKYFLDLQNFVLDETNLKKSQSGTKISFVRWKLNYGDGKESSRTG